MASGTPDKALPCNLAAIRRAARHVTRHYDHHLAQAGLRASQFSILARVDRRGAMRINEIAAAMGMDRTTLGRNLQPLERDGLVTIEKGAEDQRSKEVKLTPAGVERLRAGRKHWAEAQASFEAAFGEKRSAEMRAMLGAVAALEFA